MATESFISLRRLAGLGFVLLFLSFCLGANAQVPPPPFVVSSFATSPSHPNGWGQIWNVAVAPTGDVVYQDFEKGSVYHIPADGRPLIVVGELGGWSNMGVAIDSKNNLFLGGNWWPKGLRKIPWDPVARTWNLSNSVRFGQGAGIPASPNGDDFQPAAFAVGPDDNLVVAADNSPKHIFRLTQNPDGTSGAWEMVIQGLKNRVDWITVDEAGNIYFVEEGYGGVLRIPAGTTNLVGDGSGSIEKQPPLTQMMPPRPDDPTRLLLGSYKGVAVDDEGNVYFGSQDDSFNGGQGGIFMVPNENGTPNPAHYVLVTPMRTLGAIALHRERGVMWISTIPNAWGGWNGLKDIAKVTIGSAELGAAAVGAQGSTLTIYNAFNHDDAIPVDQDPIISRYELVPEGSAVVNFAKVGGDCAAQVYKQNERCTVTLAVKPNVVGPVEGALVVQRRVQAGAEYDYRTISTMTLRGLGQGGALAFLTHPYESTVGTGITGASQVTTDKAGNVYVAAPGLQSVLVYARGSGPASTPLQFNQNLTAPTGVAVDGLGNLFIADSGNIIEVPFQNGALNANAPVTIMSGLGSSLKLAASPAGLLFVADPDNARVLRIRLAYPKEASPLAPESGMGAGAQVETAIPFGTVTGIGLDNEGNLLVADGASIIKVDDYDNQTVVAGEVGAANAVAMGPTGALYYSTVTGAFRVPVVGGVLSTADKQPLGTGVTAVGGIALDPAQNVYLSDVTGATLHVVTVHGVIDFGAIALGDHPTLATEVFNIGNREVTFAVNGSGQFPSSNPLDFTAMAATANGCDGATPIALAAGGSCFVATTFNPGDGEEGALIGQITMSSDAVNAPVVLNASGVGAPLAASHTAITVAANASATDTPVAVTVTPATGAGIPTGLVTILIDGVATATDSLADGTVSFNLKPVKAGTHNYTAAYNGDRVYGRSTATATPTIAKGVTGVEQPALTVDPTVPSAVWLPYVLGSIQNADTYYYKFRIKVKTDAGIPTGQAVLMENNAVALGPVPVDAQGYATFSTEGLQNNQDTTVLHPITTHTVTPVYLGDDNYLTSSGTPVTFQVLRVPSVMITPASPTINVGAGSTATANLTLTSMLGYGDLGSYQGQVELQCDNLPPYTTCSFSPARVTVNGTTVGHSVLTISTNVPVGAIASNKQSVSWLFAAMFGVGAIGLVFGRKTRFNGRVLTVICAALIIGSALAGMTACANSGGSNPNPSAITPTGTYAVTVTGRQVGGGYVPGTIGWQQAWVSLPYTITVRVN